jgi:hypothetical protein
MNWSITRLIAVSAVAAALGLGASQANAQRTRFRLPVEAHWGSTVLRPGSYILSAPFSLSGLRIFYLQGDAGSKIVVPTIVNNGPATGHSHLKLVKLDGTYYIQEFVSAASHTALEFHIPHANRRELRAENRILLASDF